MMCLTLDWFWEQEGIKVQKIDLGGSTLPSSEIWGTAKKRYYERLSTQIRNYAIWEANASEMDQLVLNIYRIMFCGDTVNKVAGETLQNWEEMNFL